MEYYVIIVNGKNIGRYAVINRNRTDECIKMFIYLKRSKNSDFFIQSHHPLFNKIGLYFKGV